MPDTYAKQYAKHGWFVFPVSRGRSKPPILTGWQNLSTTDQAQITQWAKRYPGCNWGVSCEKSSLCVIDVDNKHGKTGDDSFLNLELDHDFKPTLVVKTPSGGYHHYYEALTASTTQKLGSGIDTKSIGGYVVIPGSKRPEGIYEVIKKCSKIPPLAESLKIKIGQPRLKDPDHDTPLVDLDQPHNIVTATEYLTHNAKPSIEGDGGDDNAYKVACRVRDYGISEETTFDLIDHFWNPRCQPPWSYYELHSKVQNAFYYSQNKAGIATPEADFDPIESDDSKSFNRPKSISQYVGTPPKRNWLIENWLPTGEISSLYGDGGIGKSLLALQLAASVAAGCPWLGLDVTEKMPVLAVMAEDRDDELHRRIHSIRSSAEYNFSDLEKSNLFLWSTAGFSSVLAHVDQDTAKKRDFYFALDKELGLLLKGQKLLILDTLSDVFAGNENDRQSASRFIKVVLHSLITKHELTILLLAHPSITGQNTGTFSSGSTAWNNSVRNRLIIRPHEDEALKDKYRVIECVKSNYAKAGETVTIYWENGVYKSIESGEDIFSEVDEANKEIVYQAIISWARLKQPIGVATNSANFIGSVPIKTFDGRKMPLEMRKSYTNALIADGKIEKLTGRREGNGLYPTDKSSLESEKDE